MAMADTIVSQKPTLPASPTMSPSYSNGVNSGNAASSRSPDSPKPENPAIPPPTTDKPRPHICTTCNRSFARREHLTRHERSHTKEKPFECPECSRCFARRDLLLRHQQKVHMTTAPRRRPIGGTSKEKPFECPECSRSFTRRDILLRHQQNVHKTTIPIPRPRAGARRKSTSSVASTGGRVENNSVLTAAGG
ncbi:hypothetical protein RUND412_009704 [Rhizina undulata]